MLVTVLLLVMYQQGIDCIKQNLKYIPQDTNSIVALLVYALQNFETILKHDLGFSQGGGGGEAANAIVTDLRSL